MENRQVALIPAYRPTPLLLELLREAQCAGFETVVVDDGSGEAFTKLFSQVELLSIVLRHPDNFGKGAALKTGLAYIEQQFTGDYVVVTLDADGQHKIDDAVAVCREAQSHPNSLVLGSRRLRQDAPLRSRIGNAATRMVYRVATGLRVHDTQTGLRAFGNRLLPALTKISGARYEYEMNVLLECARQRIPVREVEIETVYIDNNASSHFHALRDSCRVYGEILKFSLSSLVGFLVDYLGYSLLLLLTAGMGAGMSLRVSNVLARVISAVVNYILNRTLVFQSKSNAVKSGLQYALLAAGILVGNTLLLGILVEQLGINRFAAKLCTEMLFFFFSWLVQRTIIFRKKEAGR